MIIFPSSRGGVYSSGSSSFTLTYSLTAPQTFTPIKDVAFVAIAPRWGITAQHVAPQPPFTKTIGGYTVLALSAFNIPAEPGVPCQFNSGVTAPDLTVYALSANNPNDDGCLPLSACYPLIFRESKLFPTFTLGQSAYCVGEGVNQKCYYGQTPLGVAGYTDVGAQKRCYAEIFRGGLLPCVSRSHPTSAEQIITWVVDNYGVTTGSGQPTFVFYNSGADLFPVLAGINSVAFNLGSPGLGTSNLGNAYTQNYILNLISSRTDIVSGTVPFRTLPYYEPPSVSIQADALSGETPFTNNFYGLNVSSSLYASPTSWMWNLTGGNVPDYFTKNVSYTYSNSGTYTVNLTAVNQAGYDTASITITAVPLPPLPLDMYVWLDASNSSNVQTISAGENWTFYNTLSAERFETFAVAAGNGYFVAIQPYNPVINRSIDGKNWEYYRFPSIAGKNWYVGTFLQGAFLFISFDQTQSLMLSSSNGKDWAQYSALNRVRNLIHDGSRYLCTVDNLIYSSTDLITWSSVGNAPVPFTNNNFIYANGRYVARLGDSNIYHSTNLTTWTNVNLAGPGTWQSVAFGNGIFVAVTYYLSNSAAYSSDGVNWTVAPTTGLNINSDGTRQLYFLNNKFYIVGTQSGISNSTDGINWNLVYDVFYNKGFFALAYEPIRKAFVSVSRNITYNYSSGNSVTTWLDKSNYANHAYVITNKYPEYIDAQLSPISSACLSFKTAGSYSNDYNSLYIPASAFSSAMNSTQFCVTRTLVAGAGYSNGSIFGQTGGSPLRRRFQLTSGYMFLQGSDGDYNGGVNPNIGEALSNNLPTCIFGVRPDPSNGQAKTTTVFLSGFRNNAGTLINKGRYDYTGLLNRGAIEGFNSTSNANVLIGSVFGGSNENLSGEICEIIFYNRTLTDNEFERVITYLDSKYNIY